MSNNYVKKQVNNFYSSNISQLNYNQIKKELKNDLNNNVNSKLKTTSDTFKLMKIDRKNRCWENNDRLTNKLTNTVKAESI